MAEIPACLTVARPPPLPLLPLPAPPWSRDSKEPPVAGSPSWGQLRQPGALESWWLSPAEQEDSALTMTGRGQVHKWAGDLFNLSCDPAAVSNLVWFSWSPSPAAGVQLSALGQGGFPFSSSETPLEGLQTQSRELGMGRNGEEEWGEKGRRGMKLLGKRSVPSRNRGIW